ncbi:MAG: copper homeostasis protein CutC [Bacteroidales bacterium]|nr:copper homeostasis protein CutC [Bacteroidales bacterium]
MTSYNARIEICCPSAEAAFAAEKARANRIELCRNLETGGLTPSEGDIMKVANILDIPVNVLIRPREGTFVYNEEEVFQMLKSIYFCGITGAVNGVVIGALTEDGNVDVDACRKMIAQAREFRMEVTFHRAIDEPGDIFARLQDVINLGVDRVLSSGGAPTAEQGAETLAEMVKLSGKRVSVMPGCGVTPENASRILDITKAHEIHGSRIGIIDVLHPRGNQPSKKKKKKA